MKNRIKMLIIGSAAMISMFSVSGEAANIPKYRTITGTYYDYMCIETKDGHEWLLSDAQKKNNPYMVRKVVKFQGKRKTVYIPRFKSGQRVKVKFATMGTKKKTDDRIVSVK